MSEVRAKLQMHIHGLEFRDVLDSNASNNIESVILFQLMHLSVLTLEHLWSIVFSTKSNLMPLVIQADKDSCSLTSSVDHKCLSTQGGSLKAYYIPYV
jgi:hypothetical protein